MRSTAMPDTLEITTPSGRELRVTRVFNAPRAMVFDAFTKPELLRRWYGPAGWSLTVCEIDLRVGGTWRFVTRQPSGKQMSQSGVYREVVRPERIVQTEQWDDWNPGEVINTSVFAEAGGRTTLTLTILFPSQDVRDTLIKYGMTNGMAETYAKLDELLASS